MPVRTFELFNNTADPIVVRAEDGYRVPDGLDFERWPGWSSCNSRPTTDPHTSRPGGRAFAAPAQGARWIPAAPFCSAHVSAEYHVGTFKTLAAAQKHERAVQYFKRH
jgi:hypothetical protein